MTNPITSELVLAHWQCRRKAFNLLHAVPAGPRHDHEQVVAERTTLNRVQYLASLGDSTETECLPPSNAVSAGDLLAICDVISKPTPKSPRQHTRQEPHLVVGTYIGTVEQKLQLAFAGYVIGQSSRYCPSTGFLIPYLGPPQRIRLEPLYVKIRSILDGLRELIRAASSEPPALILNAHCPLCPFRTLCREEAARTDNLCLLERMTPKLIQKYHRKGIFTVTQLSYCYRPRRRRQRTKNQPASFNVELQALALRTNKVYLHEAPSLSKQLVEMYLDIEGIPDQDFHYLIGLMVQVGDVISFQSFWADSVEEEPYICQACIDAAGEFPTAPIYHYGSYEPRAFQHVARKHRIDCTSFLRRLVNVNAFIFGKVYFPTRSNRLKDLASSVGASWSTPDSSGLRSLAWRYRWEDGHEAQHKAMLVSYNRDDCNAIRLLTAEIQNLANLAKARPDVDFANYPKQTSTPTGDVIHKAFDGILKSAHAEYRRKRIRLRPDDEGTSQEASRNRTNHTRRIQQTQRTAPATAGKVIRVPRRRKCPRHSCGLRPSSKSAQHTLIDLAFTRNGCRKTFVKYTGTKAYCPLCSRLYLPPLISRLGAKVFGHNFRSWAVFQRVSLRLPLTAITQVIEELLSEHLSTSNVDSFVTQFAAEYARTERLLLDRLLDARFIHVDETKISIRAIDQYVWGLADGEHVVFRLTETREPTLIHTLLEGFEGVLISDFYSGYDAVKCKQQKCLAHLVGDLNDVLWKNPFNTDFRARLTVIAI